MENKGEKHVCASCGYTADGKFAGDICPQCGQTYWKCGECGFLITAATPPDVCPQCKEKCHLLYARVWWTRPYRPTSIVKKELSYFRGLQ
jgi:rubrerythrin